MKNNLVNISKKVKSCSSEPYLMNEKGLFLSTDDGQIYRISQPFKADQVVYETQDVDALRLQFLNRRNQHIKLVIKRSDLIGNSQNPIKRLLDCSFEFDSLNSDCLQRFK